MKTFSKLLSEVAQPKAEDEINFKEKHVVEKLPHSHAGDEVFKGSTKKAPKRVADYEEGNDEKVYEAMDPVGKEDDDIDNDGDVDSSDKYLHARRKAIGKAMKKQKKESVELEEKAVSQAQAIAARIALKHKKEGTKPKAGTASAEMMDMSTKDLEDFTKAKKGAPYKVNEDAWQEIPMMSRQLQFIMYAAQEIMSYLNDCDDMCVDPEEWFQNKLAHVHGQMMTLHGYIEGDRRMNMSMYGEEVEQIDEISKKTLGSYVKKASRDMYDKGGRSVYHSTKANKASGPFEKETKKKHRAKADEMERKASNRDTGIARAMNRLTKEDAELSEVPDKMLDRYRQKAFADQPAGDDGSDKYRKRKFGRDLAFDKQTGRAKVLATKESLDEAVSAGKMKLDDGTSITVSKQDADLLNQMFRDLNAKNRKLMQDTMMTDKAGFEEIVGFAREAM